MQMTGEAPVATLKSLVPLIGIARCAICLNYALKCSSSESKPRLVVCRSHDWITIFSWVSTKCRSVRQPSFHTNDRRSPHGNPEVATVGLQLHWRCQFVTFRAIEEGHLTPSRTRFLHTLPEATRLLGTTSRTQHNAYTCEACHACIPSARP